MTNKLLSKADLFIKNSETCERVLKQMKKSFTSNAFAMRLRSAGVSESFIENDYMRNFLFYNCDKIEGKRSWVKRNQPSTTSDIAFTFQEETDLEKAIQIVKNSGQYKVYKLQQEWKEI